MSWRTAKLGDVCGIELGKTPARADSRYWDRKRETGNVWLSIADLSNTQGKMVGDSKEYLSNQGAAVSKVVRKGTLLVSFKLTLGRVAFAGRDLFTNEAIAALTPQGNDVDKEFLYYFLQFFDWIGAAEHDVKLKGMTFNKAKLKEMVVRFPKDRGDQSRIVAILDEAFASIAIARANAERNRQNARELLESELRSVFFDEGTSWPQRRLSEISKDFGRGKSRHRPRNDAKLYGGGYPFIQTGDVRNASHLITAFSQTYNEVGLAQSKLWPRGTLCITIAANIAETGILDFDACFPDSVIGVVVDESFTSNRFLEYLLQAFKSRLKEEGKGSAQDNINLGTFENQSFPFPELSRQSDLVLKLDSLRESVQRLESIYQRKLAALDELKQSLIDEAFSGKL